MTASTSTSTATVRPAADEAELRAAFEKLFGPVDWDNLRPAPIYDGPTPDHLDGLDDRGLQAHADSRTVDVFGGGR